MPDELVQVPRAAVEKLVESLQDAWWVHAAAALEELREALYEVPADPPTFGKP